MQACCPKCHQTFDLGERVGGKIFLGSVGALFGVKFSNDPVQAIAVTLIGAMIGDWIDKKCIAKVSILRDDASYNGSSLND